MINIKVLKMEDTKKVLKLEDVIDCVRNVYEAKASGNTEVFPLIFQDFIHEKAEMDIKSGWLKNNEIFGLKVVSWFEENPKAGLPELLGTILIFDANTGAPVGLGGRFLHYRNQNRCSRSPWSKSAGKTGIRKSSGCRNRKCSILCCGIYAEIVSGS